MEETKMETKEKTKEEIEEDAEIERELDEEEENEKRVMKDGIYDLEDVEILDIDDNVSNKKKEAFIKKYPNYRKASAYETDYLIYLSKTPKPFKGKNIGSGFNYGSTNVLIDCPKRILILAEND
jgi:hypothetical protein